MGGNFSCEIWDSSALSSFCSILGFSEYSDSFTYPIVVFLFKVIVWPPLWHNAMIHSSGNLSPTLYNNGIIAILGYSIKEMDSHLFQSMCLATRPCNLLALAVLLIHDKVV